jgi:hypothetical protein
MSGFDDDMDGLSLSSSSGSKHPRDSALRKEVTSEKVRVIYGSFGRIFVFPAPAHGGVIALRRMEKGGLPVGCRSVVCIHWGLAWCLKLAAGVAGMGHTGDRMDFELLQRAVFRAFAPLLRNHPSDPKCNRTAPFFLLRAGWVVAGLLWGRECS